MPSSPGRMDAMTRSVIEDGEGRPITGLRLWILTYLLCCQFLHQWGERAWPWNVQVVWRLVQSMMAGEDPFEPAWSEKS